MTEFDPNKFAAEVAVQAVRDFSGSVKKSALVAQFRRTIQSLTNAYGPYLEKTYRRVSTIRTFLKPSESIDLLNAYVPVNLELSGSEWEVSSLVDRARSGEKIVIKAMAGRGKSVLMRYIALALYHNPKGKLPIFLELRSLNQITSKDLLQYIHAQYNSAGGVPFEDFNYALSKGYFVLLLDGFDEISPPDRDEIERQILQVEENFPNTAIIISGRHDDRFFSWERFRVWQLLPMNMAQTKELIEKADYDEKVRRNFLKRLTEDFFNKHESFLNTPLLAIMLMITFEEYAEIPNSLHEFYRNAFDTLVRRHDALKNQFLRPTHSGCTAEQFKRIFSSFCVLTYSKSAFSFSREEALNYLDSAIKQQNYKFDKEDVLCDLIESVCLLHEEGFEISFVHRSFQEYFCALFVASAPSGFVDQYLETANVRLHDDVLPMLYGINPGRVEEEWANEFVSDVLKKYPKGRRNRHIDFFRARAPEWSIEVGGHGTVYMAPVERSNLERSVTIIKNFYPEHFPVDRKKIRKNYDEWSQSIVSEVRKLATDGVEPFTEIFSCISERSRGQRGGDIVGFRFSITSACAGLIEAMYAIDIDRDLKAFERIQTEQRERQESGNAFVDELFS